MHRLRFTIGLCTFAVLVSGCMLGSVREAAQRAKQMNNLKMVALAVMMYETTHRTFPWNAEKDASGKPLLSWRVHILPYLEQQALYAKFKLDEPWDSPHNLPLSKTVVEVFADLESPSELTRVQHPSGPLAEVKGQAVGSTNEILDGTANTVMLFLVGTDKAAVWTKPEDIVFDPNVAGSFGKVPDKNVMAAFYDASVRSIPKEKLTPQVIEALITPAGQEAVPGDL